LCKNKKTVDMAQKYYDIPPIVWLKITNYMHGWLQHSLGGEARIKGQRVLSVQHLPGARDILRMETTEDMMDKQKVANAMSGTRKNCFSAGLDIDPNVMKQEYGVTKDLMELFVPIECPKMCLTRHGVLRPWTLDVCFGKEQASAMQRLLRHEFWRSVEDFDEKYAEAMNGDKYPAREMIEDFCAQTGTPEIHIDVIRREWQRRMKRK